MKKKLYQPFHLVTESPWPLFQSLSMMMIFVSILFWFLSMNINMMFLGLLMNLLIMYQWWRDVVRESTYQGFHTTKVYSSIKIGMMLFIISEIFFFISIFWCYFHLFLSPSVEIGENWPPKNLEMFNPYMIPLLNSLILLSSGISITWSHFSLLKNKKYSMILSMVITIILGIIFTLFQLKEYLDSSYSISDSSFGSIFFMATGFHGLHVLLGTIFLIINLIRMFLDNYSSIRHFGFEAGAWYWHFVDVVWLMLYLFIYYLP